MSARFPALLLLASVASALATSRGIAAQQAGSDRVKALKEFVRKERPSYERRAKSRKGLIDELDRLNEAQNRLRNKLDDVESQSQELTVALDNLSLELERQRGKMKAERERAKQVLHAAYRIRRDGLLPFVLGEGGPMAALGRLRLLSRALKLRRMEGERLESQAKRLAEGEAKLVEARSRVARLWEESRASQEQLAELLRRKKSLLAELDRQQGAFLSASAELEKLSKRVNDLFTSLGSGDVKSPTSEPRGRLRFPVDDGKIVRRFGREVHPQFKTVTFHKGLEIEAPHNTPVVAVLPGTVEFEGWIGGMGNVVIIHHGNGLYSLSGHLYRVITSRGTEVAEGETIGFVGDTGRSERPSLYFELRESQVAVDPLPFFAKEGGDRVGQPRG